MEKAITRDELPAALHAAHMAAFLGLDVQTVRAECRAQRIPARHVGRAWIITKEAFLRWLEGDADADRN